MDNLSIILMLAGFVLSFCCAINAIRGKTNKKIWYGMIAAYIGFGVCCAVSQRDGRNIGIAFMLICFCYIVKVVWVFLKAAVKHEKYRAKMDLITLAVTFALFIVGMMLPYDKVAAAERAAESEARAIEKAASSAAAASSKAEEERQKQAESEAAASREAESQRIAEEAASQAAADSKRAEDELNANSDSVFHEAASKTASARSESASSEQVASSASSHNPDDDIPVLDLDDYAKQAADNAVKAKDKYAGRQYKVTYQVNSVSDAMIKLDNPYTVMFSVNFVTSHSIGYTVYMAGFPESEKNKISQLSPGQTITFVGDFDGNRFTDCRFIVP